MQDIIVTDDLLIALKPSESVKTAVYGMCIQEFNGAPSKEDTYKLDQMANGPLAKMIKEIEQKKAFSIASQQAIWAITDGRPVEEIVSINQEETIAARELGHDLN